MAPFASDSLPPKETTYDNPYPLIKIQTSIEGRSDLPTIIRLGGGI